MASTGNTLILNKDEGKEDKQLQKQQFKGGKISLSIEVVSGLWATRMGIVLYYLDLLKLKMSMSKNQLIVRERVHHL